MNSRSPRFVYLAVAAALAIGVGAGFAAHSLTGSKSARPVLPVVPPTTGVSSTSSTNSLTDVYEKDSPGVVTVTVSGRASIGSGVNPFGPQQFEAMGTGFEIDSKGDIMTAEHVVAGASKIKVTFWNGSTTKDRKSVV